MIETRGFTPAVDEITKEHGGIVSLIYGAMWRYAQQSPMNICTASQEKIGSRVGIERETVSRNIPKLEESGLIKKTGKGPGGTNSYKCLFDIKTIFFMGVTETHIGCDEESLSPVTETHTKKEVKKEKDILGVDVFSSITGDMQKFFGLTPNWDTRSSQDLYQFLRERYDAGQRVSSFARWWFENDWRGKDGQNPTLNQVRTMWYQAFNQTGTQTNTDWRV